nr:MAG TPA: hypothetical protein [Caudoviricetes sp.]
MTALRNYLVPTLLIYLHKFFSYAILSIVVEPSPTEGSLAADYLIYSAFI